MPILYYELTFYISSLPCAEAVSNVTLSVNQTALNEVTSSAILKCSVSSGSSLSFLWLNSSSEVTVSDRVHIANGGSTLIVVNVTRYDQGPFSCCAFNPVSNGTSDPVSFFISCEYTNVVNCRNSCLMINAWSCCVDYSSDGPDHMVLTVNGHSTTSFPVGSNLTMLCSAQSSPPAQLEWEIRGEPQSTKGPILEVFGFTEEQTGLYTCHAFNNYTNASSSVTKHIVIAGELLPEMNSVRSHETHSFHHFIHHLFFAEMSGSGQGAVCIWLVPTLLLSGVLL